MYILIIIYNNNNKKRQQEEEECKAKLKNWKPKLREKKRDMIYPCADSKPTTQGPTHGRNIKEMTKKKFAS